MGKGTSIEWTDHSWPVANGCRRKSSGCENCYAEKLIATRLRNLPKYKGLAVYGKNGPRWTGEARLWAPDLAMPLKIRKPSRIFVADMGDLFYEGFSNEEIAAVFGVMAACPQHVFQVLTKRAERLTKWFDWAREECWPEQVNHDALAGWGREFLHDGSSEDEDRWFWKLRNRLDAVTWPLPNVHIGVSVEDQKTADERIPFLLKAPAAVRWVSAEPLLERVQLGHWLHLPPCPQHPGEIAAGWGHMPCDCRPHIERRATGGTLGKLDWIVCGGESGNRARPFDLDWARALVQQCKAAEVPVFVKQLGRFPVIEDPSRIGLPREQWPEMEWPEGTSFGNPTDRTELNGRVVLLKHAKGSDMEEWPAWMRVRQFPRPATASTETQERSP